MQLEWFCVDTSTQQTLTEQLILRAAGVGVIQELPAQKALFFQNKS